MPAAGPGKKLCGAKRPGQPAGVTCKRVAGAGTDHLGTGRCSRHGGNTKNHQKAAKTAQAVEAVAIYGLSREIDPHDALMEELHRTAGHVAWLQSLIASGELTAEQSPSKKRRTVKIDQDVFGGGQVPSVWMELYHRERQHFASVAKTCIACGIAERQIHLAEQQGTLIAQVLRGVLTELGVADRPEVPDVVRRYLTLVAGAA